MNRKQLLFATGNANKVTEIRSLLNDLPYDIITMGEIGFSEEIPETGTTLKENAIIKAEYLHGKTDLNIIAEDTGLEVDFLNGAPGVHTARFAGEDKDSNKNMDLLLSKLEGQESRSARFHTVIALILDQEVYTFEGFCEGTISTHKSGSKGFGYDPVFIPENHNTTFAEMELSEKAKMSHRSRAFKKMHLFLDRFQGG